MKSRDRIALALLAWATLVGCGRVPKEVAPPEPPPFQVAGAVSDEVTDYEEFPGHLDAVKSVEVRSRVGGYLVGVQFEDGAEVKEGAELFRIDPRPYQAEFERAEARVRQAEARLGRIDADVRRATNLFGRGAINREEADRSTGDRAEARAALDSSRAALAMASLNLDYTRVTAPLGGRLGRRLVDPGALVRAGVTPLTTIVELDPIYVYLTVDEQTLRRLQGFARSLGNGEHELMALVGLADQPGEFPFPVKISFSNNQIDAASGTLEIRGAIANPILPAEGRTLRNGRSFIPGMYARVRVPLGSPRRALLVPERSLGTDQGRKFLYVVDDRGKVVYRPVTAGSSHRGMRVVEQGLRASERFIASDTTRITPGMTITPVPVADPWTLAGEETGSPSPAAPPAVGRPQTLPPSATAPAPAVPAAKSKSSPSPSPSSGRPAPRGRR
ncbi:MAG TPA: efflux RND transporter periplasmic adaptor subunit [Isosphaeraceae bacterium]